jgi:hypothetical protein
VAEEQKAVERRHRAVTGRWIIVPAAVLFVVDLFLDWREVKIGAGEIIQVSASSSGWSGWGVLAGLAAVAIVLWELFEAGRFDIGAMTAAVTTAVLAVVVLAGTLEQFFEGDVSISGGGVTLVRTGERLWPAWVGLGLALLLVATAVVRVLVIALRGTTEPELGGA